MHLFLLVRNSSYLLDLPVTRLVTPATLPRMDPIDNNFDDFFDYGLYRSGHASQQSDSIPMQHQPFVDVPLMAWGELKLQISSFNKIVVIPTGTFTGWSPADTAQVANLMA